MSGGITDLSVNQWRLTQNNNPCPERQSQTQWWLFKGLSSLSNQYPETFSTDISNSLLLWRQSSLTIPDLFDHC